jgi:hypothetical protein
VEISTLMQSFKCLPVNEVLCFGFSTFIVENPPIRLSRTETFSHIKVQYLTLHLFSCLTVFRIVCGKKCFRTVMSFEYMSLNHDLYFDFRVFTDKNLIRSSKQNRNMYLPLMSLILQKETLQTALNSESMCHSFFFF